MHHFRKTVLLSCALLTLGAMPSQSAESLRCVSAANPSGTWYIGMGAVGKAYTNMNPGTDVTMLPGGGATNAPRLASRAADMGVAENSMLNAFKTGLEPYKAPTPKGIATVANLWDRINYQIVSPVSSPVKDLRDLKTMKNVNIGVGSTGGSTEKIFRNILKEYGITYEDIKKNGGKVVTHDAGAGHGTAHLDGGLLGELEARGVGLGGKGAGNHHRSGGNLESRVLQRKTPVN